MVNAVPEPIILPITFNVELHVVALFKIVFPDTYKAVDGVVVPIPTLPFCNTVNKLVNAEPAPPPTGFWLMVKLAVFGYLAFAVFAEGLAPPLFKLMLTPQYEYKWESPANAP